MYVAFPHTGIWDIYINNKNLGTCTIRKTLKFCQIMLHIIFPTFFRFYFYQISAYLSALSFVLKVTLFTIGWSFTIYFYRVFNNHVLFKCIGAGWLFIFVPISDWILKT